MRQLILFTVFVVPVKTLCLGCLGGLPLWLPPVPTLPPLPEIPPIFTHERKTVTPAPVTYPPYYYYQQQQPAPAYAPYYHQPAPVYHPPPPAPRKVTILNMPYESLPQIIRDLIARFGKKK
ncbi:hypothetical protein Aduo_014531 [Ancylostoma duodenale]